MIKLDSGKTVKVESFEYSYTYGGVLCGLPNEKMNRSVFEDIKYPSNSLIHSIINIDQKLINLDFYMIQNNLKIGLFDTIKLNNKISELMEDHFDNWLKKNLPNYLDKHFSKKIK